MTEKKRKAIEDAQSEANTPKEKLMDIMYRLEEAGAIRQAKSLETIIVKLERWQNK